VAYFKILHGHSKWLSVDLGLFWVNFNPQNQ